MREANETAVQSELTALAFDIMVNRRKLSVTDDEDYETQKHLAKAD